VLASWNGGTGRAGQSWCRPPGNDAEVATAIAAARHRFEGALFLMKSNQGRYGRLVQELANDFNMGRDSYPDTLTTAYELILHNVHDQD
jgi:hypothetical protein